MYTQRKQDRRRYGGRKSFPMITRGGKLVREDRRSIPDRRLGSIHLELTDALDQQCSDFFTDKTAASPGKEGT